MTYSEKLKDPRWQKKRLKVMERDGFRCFDCGDESKTLHVHHCTYQGGNPWDTSDEFLLTVCKDCHDKRHEIEKRHRLATIKIFATCKKQALKMMVYDMENRPKGRFSPRVIDYDDYEHMTDMRWYQALSDMGHQKLYTKILKKWGELSK